MLDLSLGNWWIWYEKVWAADYLVSSNTKVLEIYLLKNIKCYMMSSCMTKLEFLLEPNIIFRLGKLPLLYVVGFALSLVKHCWPLWEVCHALKNQDHVHTTHICTTPTLGAGTKTCFPSRSTQKCFTPTFGVNTKNMFDRFSITK